MQSELGYRDALASAEEIVNYVYGHIKHNIDGKKCGGVNKYLEFNDCIRNGIIDAVDTMDRLSFVAFMYGDKMHTQKYTTYKTLTDRLNALSIIIARLNPNSGSIINAVIGACDNIDVSQLIDLEQQQHPVQYDHFGRPVLQNGDDQYYKSPFPTFESFVKDKHSTKKQ